MVNDPELILMYIEDLRAQRDAYQAELAVLNDWFREQIMPLLTSSINAIEINSAIINDIQRQREIDEILRRRKQDDNGQSETF